MFHCQGPRWPIQTAQTLRACIIDSSIFVRLLKPDIKSTLQTKYIWKILHISSRTWYMRVSGEGVFL